MIKHSWLLLAILALLAPRAIAQNHAQAKLYTRVEGEIVRAAVEIKVDGGWHLFHTELGGTKAVGEPLALAWSGGAAGAWSAPRLPEPKRLLEPATQDLLGEDAWAWVHRGRFYVHAVGRLVPGADPSDVALRLTGQTCMDETGLCTKYLQELRTQGAGPEKAFASFPADLVPAAAEVATPNASAPSDDEASASDASIDGAGAATSAASASGLAAWEPEFAPGENAAARAFVRTDGARARLAIQVAIEEGYHLYHGPTQADIGGEAVTGLPTRISVEGGNVEWGEVRYPEPIELEQPAFTEGDDPVPYYAHEGTVVFSAEGEVDGEFDASAVRVRIDGQTCDDSGCTLYEDEIVPVLGGPDAVFASITDGAVSASGDPNDYSTMPLGAFLGLAVLWGIITLLMPCTYPMIPITISFFTKQAIARHGKVLPLSLAYGAGIIVIFVLIGVLLGPPIIRFATHPVTNIVIGALFLVFAFSLFGAYELRPPAFLLRAAGQASSVGGVLGVFLLGATLVVTSFTCTAPFVGSLLSVGATGTGSVGRIAIGMAVFGLTMAVPFVLLSLLPGKAQSIPRAGEWMHVLKVYLGFVELAAALKFLSNADLTWGWGILSREVFLALWVALFGSAAFFLFGGIRLKGESETAIGPWRMSAGLGNALLAAYCGLGVLGYHLDDITTSILPNYSSSRLWSGAGEARPSHTIIKDDLAAAVDLARNEHKLLLVNFTGFN